MKSVVTTKTVDAAGLAALLRPRTTLAVERMTAPGTFDLEAGPFRYYRRTVEVDPDHAHTVVETTTYQLAIPVWGFLFSPLVRRSVIHPPAPGATVWWLPPDRMDRRAAEVLSWLCVFSVITGYLGVLLSQTNTYFKSEFGSTNAEISDVLIAVRLGALVSLLVVALADRRGRKKVLLWSTYLAIVLTATGAFAPDLFWLGLSQGLARAFSAAIALVVLIIAIEEMPAGARAFAVSLLALTAGLGAGGVVAFLWVGDLAPWAWRIFYLVPLPFVLATRAIGRRLTETPRYTLHERQIERQIERRSAPGNEPDTEHEPDTEPGTHATTRSDRRRRFAMLGSSALFFNVFLAPAAGFQNEFLRTERGFSGLGITLLQVLTNVPGGLAIVVGGGLADRHGRRLVGTIGVIGGVGFTVLMYLSYGPWVWIFSALASLTGAAVIPALGVYQSELFATGSRGRANGGLNLLAVIGSVIGLKAAGLIADHFGSFAPAMAALSVGPAIVAVIVVVFYPETTHKQLEELNPEDPPLHAEDGAALDAAHDTRGKTP